MITKQNHALSLGAQMVLRELNGHGHSREAQQNMTPAAWMASAKELVYHKLAVYSRTGYFQITKEGARLCQE